MKIDGVNKGTGEIMKPYDTPEHKAIMKVITRQVKYVRENVKDDDDEKISRQSGDVLVETLMMLTGYYEELSFCMAAVELGAEPELVMHPKFLSDVASRTLHFNSKTNYPYISLIRTRKYKDRGYKIGKGNLLSIAIACASRPITDWDQAKKQLGGVYGYVVDLEIDENTEFTTERLHEIVTSIKDQKFGANFTDYEGCIEDLTGMSINEYWDKLDAEKKEKDNKPEEAKELLF